MAKPFHFAPVSGLALLLCLQLSGYAQSLSGRVLDEHSNPVPFANLFVQELSIGVSANDQGKYFITLDPGVYHVAITSVGFTTVRVEVIIKDKPVIKDFTIRSSSVELNEIEIRIRRRDPGFEIIQKAIASREKYLGQINSYRAHIYVKASEVVDKKKKKQSSSDEDDVSKADEPPKDPFAEARKKEEARLNNINLLEMQATVHHQQPDKYKEERTAFKEYGTRAGLFVPVFSETDFNFYYNLVHLKGIAEVPLISPISRNALLTYKYKLEETFKEEGQIIYKVKVMARKSGEATCNGYLFINDSTWNINRLELTMHKGGLKFFDDFTIRQHYGEIDKDVWIPVRQEFDYTTKAGPRTFKGNTVMVYSYFERNVVFPPKFFGNEVAITTQEAYDRDSVYWNDSRPEPLTEDERKVVAYRDSIAAVLKSKKYLDSIEAKYNRVTIGEVLYNGIGFRNQERKSDFSVSPLLGLLDFAVIGGFRLGPYASYFRRFKNERSIWTRGSLNIGIKNSDLQGGLTFASLYDPFRQSWFSINVGRNFQAINTFDAYLNQLSIANFFVRDYLDFRHRREFLNGLYLNADFSISNRRSVVEYDPTSILNEVIKKADPVAFNDYTAFTTNISVYYTPFQKYMREPKRKVILGSKWPSVYVSHKRGWNHLFSSDINFDYLEVGLIHNIQLGTLGNSRYSLQAGKFLNSKEIPYVDLKRFRQSDPYLLSDPMHSFQLLDTSLNTTKFFFEGHYMHHFNGAMVNNIPLVKKLKLRTVAGAGVMWVKSSGYRHEEMFGGVERIFKVGARRRLKIGFYGVAGQSNNNAATADWKVSFDLIDTWKRNWSY